MGLLDTLAGSIGAGGGGQPDLMKIVMSLVQQAGGIEGLMARLQQGGLADAAVEPAVEYHHDGYEHAGQQRKQIVHGTSVV